MSGTFRELIVWQKAMDLAVKIYELTNSDSFPSTEKFGLVSQMRRATISISSNIAEGHGRGGAVFRNHLSIAIGSARELQSQVDVSRRLGFLSSDSQAMIDEACDEVARMISSLRNRLGENES